MKLYVFCLMIIPVCFAFIAETEYPYLFTVVINKRFVPEQKNLTICAAIELVEDQFYLLPKKCFDSPSSNQEIKAALVRKTRLRFTPLIYEPFVLRWETFSDYVILEKAEEHNLEVVVVPEIQHSKNIPVVINTTNHSNTTNVPVHNLASTTKFKEAEITYEPSYDYTLERRKRYMKYKAHFKDRLSSRSTTKKLDEPPIRLPPFIEDEDKLPPRVLLTVPNSPLFTHCFILGWGTFFAKTQSLDKLEGRELRRTAVNSIKLSAIDPVTGIHFSEIWFEREKGQKYVEDLGSPMVCKVRDRGDVEVIIGLFMGGNSSLNHEFDTYRSFMGEFYYITHWAIGTNVSITGDPATWTLWPVEYNEEPKSKGSELKFRIGIFTFIVLISLSYILDFFLHL